MKLFLSSTGFDNKNLIPFFISMLKKPAPETRTLFIPAALNSPTARTYIPVFMEDLYKLGIRDENIIPYNLDYEISVQELDKFDLIFICPGDPDHLLRKMTECRFLPKLLVFLQQEKPYIGLSAGCDILAKNIAEGPGLLDFRIECHSEKGSPAGLLASNCSVVKLTDNQALCIDGERREILE